MCVCVCEEKPVLHVVSFSGGKDSTAMLCGMKDRGMKIDMILFCDTGLEFPAMYEHVKKVEKYVGIPITMLRAEKPFEYWFLEYEVERKNPKYEGLKGYSWGSPRNRWCTKELKTNVINRYLKDLNKQYNIIHYVGIAADERESSQSELSSCGLEHDRS